MKKFFGIWVLAAMLLLFAFPAGAQDVVSQAGKGKVNWTQKVITFTGDGAPNLDGPNRAMNAAQARLGAERAAKLMALRQALEVVQGIQLDASGTAGDKMSGDPKVAASVQGVIKNWSVVNIRYYSDGGVQVDVKVPLDGVLTQAMLRPAEMPNDIPKPSDPAQAVAMTEKGEKPKAGAAPIQHPKAPKAAKGPTGLIVVAKGIELKPAVAPKLLDENGKTVYSADSIEGDFKNGVATYLTSQQMAMKNDLVASNPMVVTALKSTNGVDLTISSKDAEKVRQLAMMSPALKEGKVIIVTK